jgi:methyl-accepting chemotaxis protein
VRSLKTKITLIIILLILSSEILLSTIIYHSSTSLIKESIGTLAKNITIQAGNSINPTEFQKVKEVAMNKGAKAAMKMEEYQHIREELNQLKKTNGLNYLFTAILTKDGKMAYLIDGYDEKTSKDDISLPMDIESEDFPEMEQSLHTQKVVLGELTASEGWGALVSAYSPITLKNGTFLGIIGADFDGTDIYKKIKQNQLVIITTTLIVMIISIGVSFLIASIITKPIQAIIHSIHQIKKGDLTVSIPVHSKDEIGMLASSFEEMLIYLREMIKSVKQNSNTTNQTSTKLKETIHSIQSSTTNAKIYIEELKEKSSNQVHSIEKEVKDLERVKNEMDDIQFFSSEVEETNKKVNILAIEGQDTMQDTVTKMELIDLTNKETVNAVNIVKEKSKEVEQFVTFIQEIATQTNLLALNASIEAARAGEVGKGFAVVADEVKKLATESQKSGDIITALIQDMQISIQKAVEAMEKSSFQIQEGNNSTKQTKEMFSEIAKTIDQLGGKFETVADKTEKVKEETTKTIQSMLDVQQTSQNNSHQTNDFSLFIEKQLNMVEEVDQITKHLQTISEDLFDSTKQFRIDK